MSPPTTLAPLRTRLRDSLYTPLQRLLRDREYDRVLYGYAQTDEMNALQDEAYKTKKGYAIGKVKRDKILFVSGSRNLVDWTFNVADDVVPHRLQLVSNRTARNLTTLFKKHKCTVAVGHSRGGALVAKMGIPDHKKLGLDAAMRLAPPGKRSMMNLYQKQLLDRFISRRGKNQKSYRLNSLGQYHFLTRDQQRRPAGGRARIP